MLQKYATKITLSLYTVILFPVTLFSVMEGQRSRLPAVALARKVFPHPGGPDIMRPKKQWIVKPIYKPVTYEKGTTSCRILANHKQCSALEF